jgi:hypothetical protein
MRAARRAAATLAGILPRQPPMHPAESATTWRRFLAPYQERAPIFPAEFLERWGDEPWAPTPADRVAAGKLHTQIATRVATQRLDYLDGVEQAALSSVYALFQKTRDIVDESPLCRHVDAIAWAVLNYRVRPFAAKWHRRSERGELQALDATDEFRADLAALQPLLRQFDALLLHIRDERPAPDEPPVKAAFDPISHEMSGSARWGIPLRTGGLPAATADEINAAERDAILHRRRFYREAHGTDPEKAHAVGLALSGGGIRSATFSLGVLVSLARRGILPHVDYLSTVSGGGYLGAFLSTFLEAGNDRSIGLGAEQLPFTRANGEAAALRHIRHQSKYLASGSLFQRTSAIAAQLYGMVLNAGAVLLLVSSAALVERYLRHLPLLDGWRMAATTAALVLIVAAAIVALAILRFSRARKAMADTLVAAALVVAVIVPGWFALPAWRTGIWRLPDVGWSWMSLDKDTVLVLLAIVPLLASAATVLFGRRFQRLRVSFVLLAAIAAPLFLFGVYLALYRWIDLGAPVTLPVVGAVPPATLLAAITVIGLIAYILVFDINATSPHRHYRDKLASAYLIQPAESPTDAEPFASGVSTRLSALGQHGRAPYHLINCALNVPGSNDPRMQGRLTDFFLFSARYCGSPLVGFRPTREWEKADPHLDLATAMAISGAAAAPQMGLGTMRHWSFWLSLLNVRLGYWAASPMSSRWLSAPGLPMLLREMLGTMHERSGWLNLSDGGHIENLGVYELLRRRCQYIIAIDGEQDGEMTFHALTNLQRMAAIDLGVTLDIDLDDLRLTERGFSRSHFRFCRIHYPTGPEVDAATGYLLYVKLSLTGNEGEFIRRYRFEEPLFPHHSTADQLFSEAQFEAYRSLGEHVGEKLFLRPLVGDLGVSSSVTIEEWFRRLGVGLLERRRS